MSDYARPADARAAHLASIARFYARVQPQASSYWGSELNDLKDALETPLKDISEHDFCHACGQVQVPEFSRKSQISAEQHAAHISDAARKKRKISAGSQEAAVLATCLRCNRYSSSPLKPTNPSKVATATEAQKPTGDLSSNQAGQPSSTASDMPQKKTKRKQQKGGLAAMLARSKESASNASAQQMLGFADLARKS